MHAEKNLQLKPLHQYYREKLQQCIENQHLPQAILLTGPASCDLNTFVSWFMAAAFCTDRRAGAPCEICSSCQMVLQKQHADIQWIAAEKKGGVIKIEQIRNLQQDIYQRPRCNAMKFIVIDGAEHMHIAAANALLKILEEPPSHACFLLLTEQIATLPATIVSRCQLWRFHTEHNENYLQDPAFLMENEEIIQGLLQVSQGQLHYSLLAEQWKTRDLKALLPVLYKINAGLLLFHLQRNTSAQSSSVQILADKLSPDRYFAQFDKINLLQKKMIHNLNVNTMLALEDFLMEYS